MPDPNDPNQQNPIGDPENEEGIEDSYDGEDEGDGDDGPPLELGEPFAYSRDADLLPRDDAAGVLGCLASVRCGKCNGEFEANLLDAKPKRCPDCRTRYTHALLWARLDDSTAVVQDFLDHVEGEEVDDGEEEPDGEPEQQRGRLREADPD